MISKKDFEFLFETYYTGLFTYAFRYIKSQDVASDIVQEVYCLLWAKRNEINISNSAKSYLYTSVKNRCLNHIKHNIVHSKYENKVLGSDEISENFTCEDFVENEMENYVMREISKLPPDIRELLILNKFDSVTAKKISEMKGVSVRTIEGKIARALKIIKKNIGTIKYVLAQLLIYFK